jgi:ATP phosphoribosyltransferase
VTGSTARDHGLVVGEHLFPSETVVMRNTAEQHPDIERALARLDGVRSDSAITV